MSLKAMTCAMALRGVTASEKLLLLALANYADENMTCFPSQKRLAADACLSPRTVLKLLSDLEERRMISRDRRHRPDGSRSSDSITLHFAGSLGEAIAVGTEITAVGVVKPLQGGGEVVAPLTSFEPVNEPEREDLGAAPRKRGSKFVPTSWEPKPAHVLKAQTLGLDLHEQAAAFRDFEFRDAKSDFDLAFHRWLRNARKFSNDRQPSRTAKSDHLDAVARAMVAACDRPEGERGRHSPEPGFEGGGGGFASAA